MTGLAIQLGQDFLWLLLCMAITATIITLTLTAWAAATAAHHWLLAKRVVAMADRLTRAAAEEPAAGRGAA